MPQSHHKMLQHSVSLLTFEWHRCVFAFVTHLIVSSAQTERYTGSGTDAVYSTQFKLAPCCERNWYLKSPIRLSLDYWDWFCHLFWVKNYEKTAWIVCVWKYAEYIWLIISDWQKPHKDTHKYLSHYQSTSVTDRGSKGNHCKPCFAAWAKTETQCFQIFSDEVSSKFTESHP